MDAAQRLTATEAIRTLKAQYFRAMDDRDWEALAATMTDDITFDHPTIGRHESVDVAVAALRHRLNSLAFTVHLGSMPEIEIHSPDSASGVWSLHSVGIPASAAGEPRLLHGFGRYFDDYRFERGLWRISSLRLVHLYKERAV